jgi:hypothetical protein
MAFQREKYGISEGNSPCRPDGRRLAGDVGRGGSRTGSKQAAPKGIKEKLDERSRTTSRLPIEETEVMLAG